MAFLSRCAVIACLCLLGSDAIAAPRPPNVIVILVDDMGQTDAACYGSRLYVTPHIDQLAKDGVRFTSGYSACTVCSPTRAALLTGKYPARLHITDWIAGHDRPKAKLKIPDWQKFLPHAEVTLAEQLKAAGYATASIGKWHLTPGLKSGDEAYYPEKHGFDLNVGGYARGQPPSYHAPYKIPTLPEGPKGEFLTDREAAEAVKFIEANKEKPFFLYLPHYAVHTPLGGKPDVIAKYQAKAAKLPDLKQKNATYAALVESVDDSLGTIRAALKRLKLDENTIIVFTSDNGGLIPVTDNSPFRVGKGFELGAGEGNEGGHVDGDVLLGKPLLVLVEISLELAPVDVVDFCHLTLLELASKHLKKTRACIEQVLIVRTEAVPLLSGVVRPLFEVLKVGGGRNTRKAFDQGFELAHD